MINDYTLSVYFLSRCSVCQDLKDYILANNISCEMIDCTGESTECDKIEEITSCSMYPIVKLQSLAGDTKFICLSARYDDLNSKNNNIIKKLTVGEIINYLKNEKIKR